MIDTKSIRAKVLDFAVHGKLTEQLATDGTAEELYQDVQAKKQALISSGKIKPETIQLACLASEEPFDIPSGWKWVRIQDLFNVRSALRIHQTDWQKEGVPFFRGRELVQLAQTGNADFDVYISQDLYQKNKEKGGVPQKDDILVSAVGTIGKTYVVKGTREFYYKDAYILCLENIGKIYPHFIKYVFDSPYLQHEIHHSSSGTLVPQLTIIRTKNLLIPLPPLAEQYRIVSKIDTIYSCLDIIDTLQSKYQDNLTILKSKIIDAAFQGKMTEQLLEDGTAEELYQQIQKERFTLEKTEKSKKTKPLQPISEEEKPFNIPENWKWVRLEDVYEINPKVTADNNIVAAFIPMERISAGFDRSFSYEVKKWSEASRNHTRFCNGDVAFAKISPCFENRKSFVADNLPNSLGGGTTELIILRQRLIDPLFTYYLILDERFIRLGLSTYKGTVGQQRIKNDVMFSYVFPLPPLAEQKRIVAKLEELLPLCEGEMR